MVALFAIDVIIFITFTLVYLLLVSLCLSSLWFINFFGYCNHKVICAIQDTVTYNNWFFFYLLYHFKYKNKKKWVYL